MIKNIFKFVSVSVKILVVKILDFLKTVKILMDAFCFIFLYTLVFFPALFWLISIVCRFKYKEVIASANAKLTFYSKLKRWFTFLVPLAFKKWWKQHQDERTRLFIVFTFLVNMLKAGIFYFKFFLFKIYYTLAYFILRRCGLAHYVYLNSGGFFATAQIRFFFNIFLYSFLFLFNFYLLWFLWDLLLVVQNDYFFCARAQTPMKIQITQILYSDFTPYNLFDCDNISKFTKRYYLIFKNKGPIELFVDMPNVYYNTIYMYEYIIYYVLAILFFIWVHIVKRVKHLFDDYLRDLDSELTKLYYKIFCIISLIFFFFNFLQFLVYILNLFNLVNIILFFCIYNFFVCLSGVKYVYTILIEKQQKKTIYFNFMYYFFVLIIMFFFYAASLTFAIDSLLVLYLDLMAFLQDGKTHQYLIFYEMTPQNSTSHVTPGQIKKRELFP